MKKTFLTRIMALLLCGSMLFGFSGCGVDQESLDSALKAVTSPLTEQITQISEDLATAEDEIAELKDQVATLETETETLTSEKTELEDEVAGLENEVTGLKDKVAALENCLKGIHDFAYTKNDDGTHTAACKHCNEAVTDSHSLDENSTCVCGMAVKITGVALIINDVEYTEGLATVDAESTVVVKVYGENLTYRTEANFVWVTSPRLGVPMSAGYPWVCNADGTSAIYTALDASTFKTASTEYTIQYSNDNQATRIESTLSVIYDTSKDATITGLYITVDGVEYRSGNVTIYSDSEVSVTVLGNNLKNGSNDNQVNAHPQYIVPTYIYFTLAPDDQSATYHIYASNYAGAQNFELTYNNGWLSSGPWQSTGIFVTYSEETKPTN